MKFKLYQIDLNDQTAKYCFTNKRELEKFGLGFPPPANIYSLRYEGECKTLDPNELWPLLNDNHPADYKTRSLSVSDIIVYDLGESTLALYCDSFYFYAVDFTENEAKEIKTEFFIEDGYAHIRLYTDDSTVSIKAAHLLSGCKWFKDQNGQKVHLTPGQIHAALQTFYIEMSTASRAEKHKTYEAWSNSGSCTFDDYVNIGDSVDVEIVLNFLELLPPASNREGYMQVGELHSSELDEKKGKYRSTYMTFEKVGDTWYYRGYCFLGENQNRKRFKTFYETFRELIRA